MRASSSVDRALTLDDQHDMPITMRLTACVLTGCSPMMAGCHPRVTGGTLDCQAFCMFIGTALTSVTHSVRSLAS